MNLSFLLKESQFEVQTFLCSDDIEGDIPQRLIHYLKWMMFNHSKNGHFEETLGATWTR